MSSNRVIIFDTTLRDGEQSPGASMTLDEKVRIAKALERMRVDVIEAGFAIASEGDFKSVKAVADTIKDASICSLSRALDKDIDRAGEALVNAVKPRIHTFIATSPIHMKHKLQMNPDQVVEQAVHAVKRARGLVEDVEFSCEDAVRSEIDFLCRIIEKAIDAGATTINIPDTVGYAIPEVYGDMMHTLMSRIPNSDKAIFSVHCHNDLGLAVANSLSAVMKGARQVECTINGLGERAGNASLEEIVMAIQTRHDILKVDTGIDATGIVPASRLVSTVTGFPVQPNKAIVGANAFAHESGIHQDGVLKHRETYEIMSAESVGWNANRMVLGKHSGRNAFKTRMEELGFTFSTNEQMNEAFVRFKALADLKHEIFDEDLHALMSVQRAAETAQNRYELQDVEVSIKTGKRPKAVLTITTPEGENIVTEGEGAGPVDAAFKAIEAIAQTDTELLLYSVNNITSGTDAQGEVTVRLEKAGRVVNGIGADIDIVVASAKAYIDAVNALLSTPRREQGTAEGV